MDIIELQTRLQNLINENISQTELGVAMGDLKRQTVHTRIKNGSEVTVTELLNAQKYFGKNLVVFTDEATPNTFERQNDTSVYEKSTQFGKRLFEIQSKHNFLDREMATLLKISEKDYMKLKLGKIEPTFDVLLELKRNFKVNIDWLMFGE